MKFISKHFFMLSWSLILLIGLLAYSNAFTGELVMDDGWVITQEHLAKFQSAPIQRLLFHTPRALTDITFAWQYSLHHPDTFGYNLVNVLIHILNSILVVWLARLILPRLAKLDQDQIKVAALIAGLVFVAHPIQTMAVSYIVQRYVSMATLFYLLAMISLVKSLELKALRSRAISFALILLCLFLGLASKEIIMTLPLVIALVLGLIYASSGKGLTELTTKISQFKITIVAVVSLLVSGLLLTFYHFDFNYLFGSRPTTYGETIAWYQYAWTQFHVYLIYLSKILMPVNLNADYDLRVFESFAQPMVILGAMTWLSSWATVAYFWKKQPIISFGLGWFLVTLLVDGSIIPLSDVINEYRLYLPMVGLVILFGWAASYLVRRWNLVGIYLVMGLVLLLAVLTFNRNYVYQNSLTFWRDVTLKSPGKARGFVNYGRELHALGKYQEAFESYERAIEIDPQRVIAWSNIGVVLVQTRQFDEALHYLNQALAIDPEHADALNGLGVIAMNLEDYEQARDYFEQVLELEPDNQAAKRNLELVR